MKLFIQCDLNWWFCLTFLPYLFTVVLSPLFSFNFLVFFYVCMYLFPATHSSVYSPFTFLMHFIIQNVKIHTENWFIAPSVCISAASVLRVLHPDKCSELMSETCLRVMQRKWQNGREWLDGLSGLMLAALPLQVKADKDSAKLHRLQQASRGVTQATAAVVASTKSGKSQIEETGEEDHIDWRD